MWCFVSLFLVVITSAINCLGRLVSKVQNDLLYVEWDIIPTHLLKAGSKLSQRTRRMSKKLCCILYDLEACVHIHT